MADQAQGIQWFTFVVAAFSGCLGVFGGYWVRGLESRKAEVASRIASAIEIIDDIQQTASSYWARSSDEGQTKEDIAEEGQLTGKLHLLNLILTDLRQYFSKDYHAVIDDELLRLRRSATSGDFGSTGGHKVDSRAISGCYTAGAYLSIYLQRAGREFSHRWFWLGRRPKETILLRSG